MPITTARQAAEPLLCQKTAQRAHRLPAWAGLALLIGLSTLVRFCIADVPHGIAVYPDELRYVGLAASFRAGNGLMLRHLACDFQKILYPLFLAPAFLLHGAQNAARGICLLNSLSLSLGALPVWALARRHLHSRRAAWALVCGYLLSAEMAYSQVYMSECLYFPLALGLILLQDVLSALPHGRRRAGASFLFGASTYVLYLCKEIALVFLLAQLCCDAALWLARPARRRALAAQAGCLLAGFSAPFLLAKATVFSAMGNSYHQMSTDAIAGVGRVGFLLYSFAVHCGFCGIAFLVFPLLLPLLCLPKLSPALRRLFAFTTLALVFSCGVISYTISVREELGARCLRQHMRYLAMFLWPLLTALLAALEQDALAHSPRARRALMPCIAVFFGAACVLLAGIGRGTAVDTTNLQYFYLFYRACTWLSGHLGLPALSDRALTLLLLVLLGAAALGLAQLLRTGHKRKFLALGGLFCCALLAANNIQAIGNFRALAVPQATVDEIGTISSWLAQHNARGLEVTAGARFSDGAAEFYADPDVWYVTCTDALGSAEVPAAKVGPEYPAGSYGLTEIPYLIVRAQDAAAIVCPGAERVVLPGVEDYIVYRSPNPAVVRCGVGT